MPSPEWFARPPIELHINKKNETSSMRTLDCIGKWDLTGRYSIPGLFIIQIFINIKYRIFFFFVIILGHI